MSKVAPQLAKGALRICMMQQGEERHQTFYKLSLLVGRNNGSTKPDLDLSHDNTVSRAHARISVEEENCWIEDLGSKFGTRVDGQDVRGRGKVRVEPATRVQVGETPMTVEAIFSSPSGFVELLPQPTPPS